MTPSLILCAREGCSHLWSEHKVVAFLDPKEIAVHSAVGYCHACDCPEFIPEPEVA